MMKGLALRYRVYCETTRMREHVLWSNLYEIGISAVVLERRVMCTTHVFLAWWGTLDSFTKGLRCHYSLG